MNDPEGPYQCYDGGATFVRVCSKCNRFVKADRYIQANDEAGLKKQPNAFCRQHGRVEMVFLGFF